MLFNLVFTLPVIVLASTFLSNFWHSTGLVLYSPSDWNGFSGLGGCFLIALVVGDFVGYWRHRFEHNSFLWPSHAVHHSDTEMTWLSLERFHPINRLTTFAIDFQCASGPLACRLMLSSPTRSCVITTGFFIHADLPWTYGKWNILFVSPAMHRWHHSANEEAYGRNFATIFGLWDWAFGTHYVPGTM